MIYKDKTQQDSLEQELLKTKQSYNSTQIELLALQQLKLDYPTSDKQMDRINQLINEFGDQKIDDKKVATDQINIKTQKPILQTIAGAKNDVLDIMCLAQLLFEDGNNAIIYDIYDIINKMQRDHIRSIKKMQYPNNLTYLQKCLTNFKPSIYKNLKEHFAEKYEIEPDEIKILPKTTGQQVGAKVVIPDPQNKQNIKVFYVKSHQEFSSKSDPQLGTRTSNGLGYVDLKELFMYKVLEKIGYGPKTEFIIDKDVSQTGVEEGIMIVTQDSGYTKNPLNKDKSFKTFEQVVKDGIDLESISNETRKDITAIDMLSRVFCLGDVMINSGNFGRVDRVNKETNKQMPDKWKILDLLVPKTESEAEDRYNYTKLNKKYGQDIVGSFIKRNGNPAHTYEQGSLVSKILLENKTENLWKEVVKNLSEGKSEKKIGIKTAIEEAYKYIESYLDKNAEVLGLKDKAGEIKPQTERRMGDLDIYCKCALKNFEELASGIKNRNLQQQKT